MFKMCVSIIRYVSLAKWINLLINRVNCANVIKKYENSQIIAAICEKK